MLAAEGKKDRLPKKRGVRGNNAATTPRSVLRGRVFGFAQWLDESVTKAVPVLAPNSTEDDRSATIHGFPRNERPLPLPTGMHRHIGIVPSAV